MKTKFPPEIWRMIFQHLNAADLESVSLTCKALREIVLDQSLFKKSSKQVCIGDMFSCPRSLGISRFTSRLDLIISKDKRGKYPTPKSVMNEGQPSGFEMHPCWNRIGELLGSVDFFDLTLENLNACFTLVIKSSHLQRIVFEGTRLQDNHLVIIADNCQGLKSFSSDAGSAVEVTDSGLKALAEKCHQLVEFKVEDGFYGN